MNAHELEQYWFDKGKQCGEVRPIRWQAWLMIAVYTIVIAAAAILLVERTLIGFLGLLTAATASLLIASHHKTPGGLFSINAGRRRSK